MKDGDTCPECGCGTMRGEVSRAKDRPPILRYMFLRPSPYKFITKLIATRA